MIDPQQFRALIVRPTLERLGQYSPAAEALLLGTAVVESGLTYLVQHGGGPALGVYQVEPATHDDVFVNFLNARSRLREQVIATSQFKSMVGTPPARQMVANLAYATAIARQVYWRQPEPLPAAGDIEGLARYWKDHFNTRAGAGRRVDFVRKAGKYLR